MTSKTSNWLAGTGCLIGFIGIGLLVYFIINGNTKMGIILIISFWILAIILLNRSHNEEEMLKEKQMKYMSTFRPNHDFKETQAFTSPNLLTRIAYDEELKQICIWAPQSQSGDAINKVFQNMPYDVFEYNFSDILAAEIYEDGYSIAATLRNSPSAIQILEGVFKEEYDAISESIQNEKEPNKRISTLELKLLVNDMTKPIHRITFYTGGSLNKDAPKYREILSEIRQWHIIINFAMKEADNMEMGAAEISQKENKIEVQELVQTAVVNAEWTDDAQELTQSMMETPIEEEVQLNVEEIPEISPPAEEDTLSDFEKLLEANKRKQFGDK